MRKFVVVGSFLAISAAAAKTTLETEYWTQRMVALSSVWSLKTISNTDLKRVQNAELIQVEPLYILSSVLYFFTVLVSGS